MAARSKSYRIYIDGQAWKMRFCRVSKDIFGDCDYEEKTIRISNKLTGEEKLNTILHELIHARWPDIAELSVRHFADELAGIVSREGFRDEADNE